MTKKQVLADFKENILPDIKSHEHNGKDIPMRAEAWNNHTDYLCKAGLITSAQYNNWSNPF